MKGLVGVPITLALVLIGVREIDMVPEAMKQLTHGFLKVLEECKTEEYDQISRDAGCVIHCMSKKLQLFGDDGKIHHENIKEFAVKNGAEEKVAAQLLSLAHECEKKQEGIEDECERTLEVAKCFRRDVKQIDWVPKMEVLMTEVIEA
ncbi:hypothetical protein ABMA27_006345 [Loxostege sticticalis]|uniref:Uncharacterized protein n=1 Tax=Loxostege sticticalis TaxID=481309 RepID=A0ABR3HIF5_LOXSC